MPDVKCTRAATTAIATATFSLMALTASSAECSITVGMIMQLTGSAGQYGQAAAKAVEMAFRDLNDAGGAHACRLLTDTHDSQGQATVAVDAANQLVQLKKVPVIIGDVISSTTLPILTSVAAPAKVILMSPAASSPRLTALSRDGKTNGMFFRTVTSDALQGTAAAKFALERGLRQLCVIYVNNDFGIDLFKEFSRAYRATGGSIVSATPYNERQSSYGSEVTAAMAACDGLYLISTPIDGAVIARAWISQGSPRRFLLNDGMNSGDFITAVGAKYLNEAYGTSSGTRPTASTQYFNSQFPLFCKIDPASPAADRAYDAGAIVGLALAAANLPPDAHPNLRPSSAAIRAAIFTVTDPTGLVIHAGKNEFSKALDALKNNRPVRYEGVIGPISFDSAGDVTGPFRLWKITDGKVTTIGDMSVP